VAVWYSLKRAKANTRCLSSILFNSIHMRGKDHPSQDHFKGIVLIRCERRTFSRPNISCFELPAVHSFYNRVLRYAGSWVHIVFNTNISYIYVKLSQRNDGERRKGWEEWRKRWANFRVKAWKQTRDGNKCNFTLWKNKTIFYFYRYLWKIYFN